MKSLRAGQLRHCVMLRRVNVTRDDRTGGEMKSTEDVATVWVAAEAISNRKIRTLDQDHVVETWLFTLRPRPDVGIDWQIVWQSCVFTVRAADRSKPDRLLITAEADRRHDRV